MPQLSRTIVGQRMSSLSLRLVPGALANDYMEAIEVVRENCLLFRGLETPTGPL